MVFARLYTEVLRFQELKNQFISLLLSIQQKRRNLASEKKRQQQSSLKKSNSCNGIVRFTYCRPTSGLVSWRHNCSVYMLCDVLQNLTTVIPYDSAQGPPTIDQLRIYNKCTSEYKTLTRTVSTLISSPRINLRDCSSSEGCLLSFNRGTVLI